MRDDASPTNGAGPRRARRTPTQPDTISAPQEAALIALLAGQTTAEAAAAAGVTRQTVSEWRCRDPRFQAALNRARAERWAEVEDKLRALHLAALEIVARELDGPEARETAVAVLKVLSRMDLKPHGPTSVADTTLLTALGMVPA